jgi:antirestriction protein
MTKLSNHDDIIDSLDVIERIAYLANIEERDEDEDRELTALRALAAEAEGSPDWTHGETLIRESYFKEYAQELADDLCYTDREAQWPYTCIDWDHAARELRYDYFAVDFDGVTYLIRN